MPKNRTERRKKTDDAQDILDEKKHNNDTSLICTTDIRLSESEGVARGLLEPGSWLVQGTLGLAYPGSYESHVCLAEWYAENTSVLFLSCLCVLCVSVFFFS